MRTVATSLVWPAILSAAMLLPCASSSFAEEFANTGAAPSTRYSVAPEGSYASGGLGYGSPTAPYLDGQSADPYSSYAASGLYGNFACEVSPGDPWRRGFCEPVAIVTPY